MLTMLKQFIQYFRLCNVLCNLFYCNFFHHKLLLLIVFFTFLSAIVDVGAAHFKYDMRRLTEILAFPRAWYRRSIVRRLFLGDFTGGTVASDWDEQNSAPPTGESPPNHSAPLKRQSSR